MKLLDFFASCGIQHALKDFNFALPLVEVQPKIMTLAPHSSADSHPRHQVTSSTHGETISDFQALVNDTIIATPPRHVLSLPPSGMSAF